MAQPIAASTVAGTKIAEPRLMVFFVWYFALLRQADHDPNMLEERRQSMINPYINDQTARAETSAALGRLLADSCTIYLKTQGFHWNVVGPQFEPLHTLFQDQYKELAQAIDEVAERIRTLGAKAPASYSEFKDLTSISEETGAPSADAMIGQLVSDHTTASRTALQVVATAESQGDVASADLATQRVAQHEKTAWMLSSLLQRMK